MFSKEVIVRCESGLHNKQATYFVQKANEYDFDDYSNEIDYNPEDYIHELYDEEE